MRETHARSVTKAFTWRILATLTTTTLVFIFTRDLTISIGVGILEAIAKMILYYGHERAWERVKWGAKG